MLNPSTAGESKNDPTLLRCIRFTESWGFGGLVVVNLYPLVTSYPKDLHTWLKADSDRDFPHLLSVAENYNAVREKARGAGLVIAAWGQNATKEGGELAQNFAEEDDVNPDEPPCYLHCLGVNADGSPRHPLSRGRNRVPDNQKPVRWEWAT